MGLRLRFVPSVALTETSADALAVDIFWMHRMIFSTSNNAFH
jgi:hypothetical protein